MHQYKLTTHFTNQKWNIPQIIFDKSDKYDTMHIMRITNAFANTLCKTSNGLLFKDSICLITSSLSLGYGFKKISI